jgi:phage terminase small subunit
MTQLRPRPPLPSNIKLLGRTAQERVDSKQAGRSVPTPPCAPDWLNEAARAEWERLAPCLATEWQPRYADALAVYCTLLVAFKANPAGFNAAKLSKLRGMQAALGLTPRARAALNQTRTG